MAGTCGTGGWIGPLPGDPDNNSILTAVAVYGGINVSWTYPTINPEAVAYVELYRGSNSILGNAVLHQIASGSSFFDAIPDASAGTYFYWIRLVSVHGTQGDPIGPASATSTTIANQLITLLMGQLDESVLVNGLKTKIANIAEIQSDLTTEVQDRLFGDAALAGTVTSLQTETANLTTAVLTETNARVAADSAQVTSINGIAAQIDNPTTGLNAKASVVYVDQAETDAISAAATASQTLLTTYKTEVATQDNIFTETWSDANALTMYDNGGTGQGELSIIQSTEATLGGKLLHVGNNSGNDQAWKFHKTLIPFDPNKMYKISARMRRLTGSGGVFLGFVGIAADGVTKVNTTGVDTVNTQHTHGANNKTLTSAWEILSGYTKGYGATNGTATAAPLITAPGTMHPLVRYLRPVWIAGWGGLAGEVEIDYIKVEEATAELVESTTTAAINAEASTRASADSALSSSVTTLQTTVGGHTTSIQTVSESVDGIQGKHTVKIDNNGYVTGYGLISTANNGVPTSEFAIVADKFSIAPVATDPASADGSPFFHLTAPTVIGGVTVPAGTYMKAASIHDASITNAKIANVIQSETYVAGTTGWKIDKTGDMEMNNAVLRGSVRGGQEAYNTGTGFWMGKVGSVPKFSLGNPAGHNLTWDGTTLSIVGSLSVDYAAVTGTKPPADATRNQIFRQNTMPTSPAVGDIWYNTFDLKPSYSIDFTLKEWPSVVTARASIAGYYNASGVWVDAANNIPRFDYDPNTGKCLGFLSEGTATNLLLHSNGMVGNGVWVAGTSGGDVSALVTAATSAVLSRDGVTTMARIIEGTDATAKYHHWGQNFTAADRATPFTVAFDIKPGEFSRVAVRLINGTMAAGGTWVAYATFNLNDSTVSNSAGTYFAKARIIKQANGIYRVALTCSQFGATGSGTVSAVVLPVNDTGTDLFIGTGTKGFYASHAQAEANPVATSPILTTTATAARTEDSAYVDLGSWFNPLEGTAIIEALQQDAQILTIGPNRFLASFSRSTNGNYDLYFLTRPADAKIAFSVIDNTTQASLVCGGTSSPVLVDGEIFTGVGAYKLNNVIAYRDGVSSAQDSTATIPTALTRLYIGRTESTNVRANSHIRKFKYYNRRMTDSELAVLSSGIPEGASGWWNGTKWQVIGRETDLTPAIDIANAASTTATSAETAVATKITTFFATSAPTATAIGDLWYNSTDKLLKRWNGATWDLTGNAYTNASDLTNDAGWDSTSTALTTGVTINGGGITMGSGGVIKAGQTAYNTGVGFFLGQSGGVPKFSIGDPNGNYMNWDGSKLTMRGDVAKYYSPGALVIASADATRSYGDAAYNTAIPLVKVKEIAVDGFGSLSYSVRLNSRVPAIQFEGGPAGYVYIYKNGSLVYTHVGNRTSNGSAPNDALNWYWTFTGTIAVNPGDAVQVYFYQAPSGAAGTWYWDIDLFRLSSANAPAPTVNLD